MKDKNFFITTPIYYPSGQPHMGHAYSSIIADVFARFKRNDGWNVYFLTGTDEHGLKIQKAAEKKKLDPLSYCNEISKIFRDLLGFFLHSLEFICTFDLSHSQRSRTAPEVVLVPKTHTSNQVQVLSFSDTPGRIWVTTC